MAWTSPRTWVALETVTSALLNTHVRDNLNALQVVTTKGDIAVATASVTLTRLAVGTNGAVLVADSVATPGVRWSSTGKTASGGAVIGISTATTLTAAANADALTNTQISGVFAKGAFTGLQALQLTIAAATATGAGTILTAYGLYFVPQTIGTTNWNIYAESGNSTLTAGSGLIFIGDTSNANMTTGLTLNQGAADDEILTLKSSDVAHGMTTITETDTFVTFKKMASDGLRLTALGNTSSDISAGALHLWAIGTGATTTTKTTSAGAAIVLEGSEKSGTGVTGMTANSNIVAVQSNGTTQFILDADGDSHQNIGTAWTNFDREDDIALLNTLAAHVTRKDDPLRRDFGKWLRTKRGRLEELKLVTFNRGGKHFVNMSRLTMLHTGALRALGAKLEAQAERLLLLEKKVLQLTA